MTPDSHAGWDWACMGWVLHPLRITYGRTAPTPFSSHFTTTTQLVKMDSPCFGPTCDLLKKLHLFPNLLVIFWLSSRIWSPWVRGAPSVPPSPLTLSSSRPSGASDSQSLVTHPRKLSYSLSYLVWKIIGSWKENETADFVVFSQ